jgi:hypothetical protein
MGPLGSRSLKGVFMGYEENRKWADDYKDQILAFLKDNGHIFLRVVEANLEDDMDRATDWRIEVTGGTVASRVRSDGRDFRDLTIRTNGRKSELDKIKEGFARWHIYCWTDVNCGPLVEYMIVDLDRCRACGILSRDWRTYHNPDGTHFIAINVNELRKAGYLTVDRVTSDCPPPRRPSTAEVSPYPLVPVRGVKPPPRRERSLFDDVP